MVTFGRELSLRAGLRRLPVLKATGGLVKGVNPFSNKAMLAALEDDA